ncbi:TPA: hypothetical protein ACG3ND_000596 [Staphylococcus aureus]
MIVSERCIKLSKSYTTQVHEAHRYTVCLLLRNQRGVRDDQA